MFRKRKEAKASDAQASDAQAQTAQPQSYQAPASSGGYHRSELTTFDGKGNPSVIVYSTDREGRTVKTRMGRRRGGH